ncbi:MAG: SLC26A/SulP transporter family protein, partial [Deltaproteobacteria bacterium]|nr:SLC26A/SulP transporter family protein [Deltaproteobacteria bacterium]
MKIPKLKNIRLVSGDFFGGLAAMLVALPSAIAFGLVVYAPLGSELAPRGALTGILGAIAIGIVTSSFNGTPRLISAPCAPAAAVLATLVTTMLAVPAGMSAPLLPAQAVPAALIFVTLLSGLLQFAFGAAGGGKFIKYIPYPVVAGYLSGVGVLIIVGQLPKFLGLATKTVTLASLASSNPVAVSTGAVSILVMIVAPRLTRKIPAPIFAIAAGAITYLIWSLSRPELLLLQGNPLLIGPLPGGTGTEGVSIVGNFFHGLSEISNMSIAALRALIAAAATLAVLLSIDTLKTCVVVDALTRSRHDSNRELIGQGLGNAAAALAGGMPGAGTMGATLVNVSGGGQTRASGFLAGFFSLATFLVLGNLIAWVPFSALAGILLVVGFRMIDRHSFQLLRRRSTVFDFVVILAVVLTAVFQSLIAASGVGIALAILLFLREQIRGSVVRRKLFGSHVFSKKKRLPSEIETLEKYGGGTVVFQLQGALFFGTADQLYTELEPHLKLCRHVILDMKRVQSVDFTAAHRLEQIGDRISEREGYLVFSDLPASLPTGQNLKDYFDAVGLIRPRRNVKTFMALDDALEWAEDEILKQESHRATAEEERLSLGEIELFSGISGTMLEALKQAVEIRSQKPKERIFSQGERGDELFLIRKGLVRILLPLEHDKNLHLATFGQGDFFGDMSFLDNASRSADAVTETDADLYVISRKKFDALTLQYPDLGKAVFFRLAHCLAVRLRHADAEL